MPLKNTREVPAGPVTPVRGPAGAVPTGPAVIAQYLKTLPNSPGVYRMIDAEGTVIYVGKARSLKARVTSYARAGTHSNRIVRMIANTAAMEFVSVRTEAEALLLEANLIKRFRPRYNVLLRDDKSFPFILLASEHRAPQILKHRGARNRKGEYFGPFASAGAVNRTINMLERAFLLRSCSDPGVREPHAAVPAAPDQALLGAMHRRDRPRRVQRAGRGGRALPARREPERARDVSAADAGSGRPARLRAGRQISQPSLGSRSRHRRPGHQSRGRRGSRRVRRPPGWRADVRSGVLLPLRPELGQPRVLPQGRSHICHRRGAGELHRPVLRRQAGAAPHSAVARSAEPAAAGRCAVHQGRAPRRSPRAAARRQDRRGRARAAERARGAGTQAGGELIAADIAEGSAGTLRAAVRAAPHRGVRQQPHPGHATRSGP